jgi:MFS family permease
MAIARTLRNNGLSIVLAVLFLATLLGQSWAGHLSDKADRRDHAEPELTYGEYLQSPQMLEATMENWESEFFQMSLYVILTIFLFQKGSVESKDPDETREEVDREPDPSRKGAPGPVRRGGLALALYKHSLSIALVLLFLVSFVAHAAGGAGVYNAENAEHGDPDRFTALSYMGTSRFWFESLQNWQSEFLAVLAIVVLSIWLRQKGSPESKPVDAPHSETGE